LERKAIVNIKRTFIGIVVFASVSLLAFAAQQNSTPDTAPAKQSKAAKAPTPAQDEGERVFQRNCSRCHAAPEGFSPRISGTIVRHMRVRASLSRHDEKALLRFLNP
jgi:cytochrome c5